MPLHYYSDQSQILWVPRSDQSQKDVHSVLRNASRRPHGGNALLEFVRTIVKTVAVLTVVPADTIRGEFPPQSDQTNSNCQTHYRDDYIPIAFEHFAEFSGGDHLSGMQIARVIQGAH
jgi:hypothetical protein